MRTDIAAMASELRDAFATSGPKIEERRTGTGRAYLVDGRMVGQVDETPGSLRVRMWLAEKERTAFERRPTFDSHSGWMVVVSDDDVGFVRGLVPVAYRSATEGKQTATPAASEMPPKIVPSAPKEATAPKVAPSGRPSRSRAPRRS